MMNIIKLKVSTKDGGIVGLECIRPYRGRVGTVPPLNSRNPTREGERDKEREEKRGSGRGRERSREVEGGSKAFVGMDSLF